MFNLVNELHTYATVKFNAPAPGSGTITITER